MIGYFGLTLAIFFILNNLKLVVNLAIKSTSSFQIYYITTAKKPNFIFEQLHGFYINFHDLFYFYKYGYNSVYSNANIYL
jgi:hypothetical protein